MMDVTIFLIKFLEVVQYIKKILYNVDNEVKNEKSIYCVVISYNNFKC
jgi:hypothetical protein